MISQITVDVDNVVTGTFQAPEKLNGTIEVPTQILVDIAIINGRCKYVNGVVSAYPQTAAEIEADKERQLNDIQTAIMKMLFDHENRIRAITRANRAIWTAAQNTTASNNGMELTRAAVTGQQFRDYMKSLM